MRIQDLDSKEFFEIDNEKLEKIKELAIGELTSQGLLDIFSLLAGGRGKNDKKRFFRFDPEWSKEKKELLTKYDEAVQEKVKADEERSKVRSKIEELSLELSKLHIQDAGLMTHIDDLNSNIPGLKNEIEKFVGGNIDMWR